MTTLHGRCLCGAVTFEAREPQMFLECHCGRCRNWTGCASTPAVVVGSDGFAHTAGQDVLRSYAEDGFSSRHFCGRCGTSLYTGGPDTFYVNAGVLDDASSLALACHIQVAGKAPWHEIGGAAPQHAQFP